MDKTFVKGMSLLELLARSPETRSVAELSEELGLTKSNVYRLLATMQHLGYVKKAGHSQGFELTSKLWQLGAMVRGKLDLIKVSQEAMVELERSTKETVHLSIRDGDDVVYVDKLDGSHPIKAYTSIGGRAPAWCVATGKAMLAFAPEATLADLPSRFQPFTERSITDPAALAEELATVRKSGFAVNKGEWREGVSGIAAPIWDVTGNVVAAIGISGPTTRFRQKDIKANSAALLSAAKAISALLGYSGAQTRD
ncbi:IclR family transcriptional regulator [Paracoccus thiocyanatus]|uniref:IclR family transcriptional regulator n=1 Tax=Paracoccus thiocyanatus TaxID=34006 RepID=A0A3D8PBN0_9RHOB|nr:IclR family transcriptional regulator [Paracoccus thiocyanatus]RDW13483.1 IclR family transcriptional regulator [Paracoccus thiocyanatus]